MNLKKLEYFLLYLCIIYDVNLHTILLKLHGHCSCNNSKNVSGEPSIAEQYAYTGAEQHELPELSSTLHSSTIFVLVLTSILAVVLFNQFKHSLQASGISEARREEQRSD